MNETEFEKEMNKVLELLKEGIENPRKTIKERFDFVLELRRYHHLFKKEGKSTQFKKRLIKNKSNWEKLVDIYGVELMIQDKDELDRYCKLKKREENE